MSIAQENLDTLHTTQLFLIRAFDTEFSDIVARLVVLVLLNVGRRYLSHITQHMGTHRILILAHAALLDIEARETEHLLLKDTEVLIRELAHENLLGETRITRITVTILDSSHATVEFLTGNAKCLAELKGIEATLDFIHHHHDIISRLVIHQQFTCSVENGTTRGIFDFLEEGIRIGTLLIVVARNLKHEEADGVDYHYQNGYTSNDETPVRKTIIFHFARTLSIVRTNKRVSRALLKALSSHICHSKKLKASKAKNTTQ